jgi:hypothetical protein
LLDHTIGIVGRAFTGCSGFAVADEIGLGVEKGAGGLESGPLQTINEGAL